MKDYYKIPNSNSSPRQRVLKLNKVKKQNVAKMKILNATISNGIKARKRFEQVVNFLQYTTILCP